MGRARRRRCATSCDQDQSAASSCSSVRAVAFEHEASSELGERYRVANAAAHRFVRRLERDFVGRSRFGEMQTCCVVFSTWGRRKSYGSVGSPDELDDFNALFVLFGPPSRPSSFFCSVGSGILGACSGGDNESSSDSGTDASDGATDTSMPREASPSESSIDAPAQKDASTKGASIRARKTRPWMRSTPALRHGLTQAIAESGNRASRSTFSARASTRIGPTRRWRPTSWSTIRGFTSGATAPRRRAGYPPAPGHEDRHHRTWTSGRSRSARRSSRSSASRWGTRRPRRASRRG